MNDSHRSPDNPAQTPAFFPFRPEGNPNLDDLQRWAMALELTFDSIIIRDGQDKVVYFNRGAEHEYGWTREEATGKVTHELLETAFPEPLEEIMRKLRTQGLWEGILTHTTKSGTLVRVLVKVGGGSRHRTTTNPAQENVWCPSLERI
jgi:PAS domain S-box-containing protein